MVLTDRQRADLHAGIYEYLTSQPGEPFAAAASCLAQADPSCCSTTKSATGGVSLLEKKWTAVPRLQKKVLELERALASSAAHHAHRGTAAGGGNRRMLPRPPAAHTLQGHNSGVVCVELHPVFTVVVSGGEDATIKVWDHESGEYLKTLKGHTGTVHSLSFTPTGSHLASCSSDLCIKLWDFGTYSCIRTLRGHDHTISSVRFVPFLSPIPNPTSSPTTTTTAGETTASSNNSDSSSIDTARAATFFLLSASRDTTVKLWDLETGFCEHTFSDHADWVRCLAVSDNGEQFASSGNDAVINVYHSRKKVGELRGHEHVVESLSFPITNDRNRKQQQQQVKDYLASGGRDRTVRLWSMTSWQCLAVFKCHENWVRSVLIHASGKYILSAGDDRTIRVLDIESNRCLRTIENAHAHFVTSIAMHQTLSILVSGGVDATVKCWQLD